MLCAIHFLQGFAGPGATEKEKGTEKKQKGTAKERVKEKNINRQVFRRIFPEPGRKKAPKPRENLKKKGFSALRVLRRSPGLCYTRVD